MNEVLIETLDSAGDGVFASPEGRRAIPFGLPGDSVRLDGETAELVPASPDRVVPPCPVFGTCGGCRMLHAGDALYARWKAGLVEDALRAAGLSPPMTPMVRSPLPSRRRMTLSARATGKTVHAGYFARASHDIIDISACPALEPALDAALPALREIAIRAAHAAGEARLTATLCDNGIDVALAEPPRPRKDTGKGRGKDRRRKRRPAEPPPELGPETIIRLSRGGEVLLTREQPVVTLGGVAVPFPPGAFIQATRAGEDALREAVLAGVGTAGKVLDAFCGLGTFALPLAHGAAVTAVDVDGPAIAALEEAVRHAGGLRPFQALRRDLSRHPLGPRELAGYDAVVFDPPRAGARGLAEALAGSDVPTVVAVSCEPRTLARDCAILCKGGYDIVEVRPVDQFVASAHVEAVVSLRRR